MIRIRKLAARLAAGAGVLAVATASMVSVHAQGAQAATLGRVISLASIPVNTPDWSAFAGFGSTSPSWFKDSFGIVHLEGAATQQHSTGRNPNLLGTLPRPARPARNVFVLVHTFAGTYADLEVAANGQITLIPPRRPAVTDFRFVSLEGITYRPSGTVHEIFVNRLNYSDKAHFGSTVPAWFKDGSGIVHLQGAVRQTHAVGADQNVIGNVPAAARPARDVFEIVHTFNGTYADLEVATSGEISLIDPFGFAAKDFSFVSLEDVSYSPGAIFNSMAPPFTGLNTANWSGNAGFGSSEPGWNLDNAGAIHLQGAVKQTSLSGDTQLIATLPAIIRPHRTIFTIVHTFNGTYADVSIGSDGQIRLINPRAPLSKDFSFVSLEGVTYLP
ncbi:MAG TPA: hypothetical protein VKU77_27425 [Streptosporangiaceae bacterium]|nr:hypothetical protein [Streptosporangiaceae bacterium]